MSDSTQSSRGTPDDDLHPQFATTLDQRYPVTEEHRARFDRDGFVRLRRVLPREVVEAYEPEITHKVIELNTNHLPISERSTYDKAFLQVTNLARQSAVVRRFVTSARLAGIAASLLGVPRVRLYSDQALYKEPGGGITPWHADQYYWPLSSDRSVTAWIPLQDTPSEMGPLEFARASHQLDIGRDIGISDESEARVAAQLEAHGLALDHAPYELGDASWHLGWTFHRARANESTENRRVMTIVYVDAEIRATEPRTWEHRESLEITMGGIRPGERLEAAENPVLPEPVDHEGATGRVGAVDTVGVQA